MMSKDERGSALLPVMAGALSLAAVVFFLLQLSESQNRMRARVAAVTSLDNFSSQVQGVLKNATACQSEMDSVRLDLANNQFQNQPDTFGIYLPNASGGRGSELVKKGKDVANYFKVERVSFRPDGVIDSSNNVYDTTMRVEFSRAQGAPNMGSLPAMDFKVGLRFPPGGTGTQQSTGCEPVVSPGSFGLICATASVHPQPNFGRAILTLTSNPSGSPLTNDNFLSEAFFHWEPYFTNGGQKSFGLGCRADKGWNLTGCSFADYSINNGKPTTLTNDSQDWTGGGDFDIGIRLPNTNTPVCNADNGEFMGPGYDSSNPVIAIYSTCCKMVGR